MRVYLFELLTSDVATTSTDISFLSKTPNTLARKPYWPSILVDTISKSVTFFFMTIDVNSDVELSGDVSDVITVPTAFLLNEFFTRTGMLDCCTTQSPKDKESWCRLTSS